MRFYRYLTLILVLLIQLELRLDAGEADIEYYEIRGKTESELVAQMDANSGIRQEGRVFRAHTSWNISWNYH